MADLCIKRETAMTERQNNIGFLFSMNLIEHIMIREVAIQDLDIFIIENIVRVVISRKQKYAVLLEYLTEI